MAAKPQREVLALLRQHVFLARSPADTERLGEALAEFLFPGAVVALEGPLGAGKTFLVRAIARGMGVRDPRVVTSPTFVLIQEYVARLPIHHFDAYRLNTLREFADLGAEEYLAGEGVCLVEWADRVAAILPRNLLRIQIALTGDEARQITLSALGDRYEDLLTALLSRLGVGKAPDS